MYYGSWKINDTPTFVINTHNPTNGMAQNADATPSYHVYEDETATPILTGTMALLNNPNTIGFYSEQITLSAANGFEKGKSYNIYVRAVVANVTGTTSHNFQIEAEVDANAVSVPVTAGMVTGSVLGNVDGSVGSVLGNVAGSVNSVVNPVTAGNVTGSVFGNVNGSVGSVVNPVGINTGTFLSALADAVWDEAIAGHLTAGSVGAALNAAGAAGDPWSTALPGAYIPGQAGHILASRMPTGTVIVGTNNDKTGYSLATPQAFDLIGNISGTLTDVRNVLNPVIAGVVTGSVLGNVNGSVASVTAPVTVGTNNDKTGYSLSSPQSFNLIGNISGTLSNVINVLNPVVAGVVTGSVLGNVNGTVASVVGNVGGNVVGNVNGNVVGSVGSVAGNVAGSVNSVTNPVTAGNVTGSVFGNVNGSVGSVVQPVGINTGTFLDALADKVWDEQISGHLTAGSVGNALNAAGSAGDPWSTPLPGSYVAGQAGHILASRMPTGTVLVGDKTGFSLSTPQAFDLIGNISGTLSNVNTVVNPVTVGTNNDKTGYSLSSPQSVNIIGNISGTITNVLNVVNPVVAGVVTGSVLGNVNGSVNSVTTPVGVSTGSFINAIADQVWDEQLSAHLSAGSAGSALNGAGSAGDPWTTPLPGAYGAGTAGHILASRMPTGTVIVGTNNDKTGYSLSSPQNINIVGNISGTFVGSLSGSVGSVTDMSSTLLNKIADFILRRPLASARASSDGDAVTFRSLLGAASKLVNRWKISGTTLTVYEENDTTAAGTQALTGTAGADPITEVDTNG